MPQVVLSAIPKVVYNNGGAITLTFTLPPNLWTPTVVPDGGFAKSTAGVPEAFVRRWDSLVKLHLRFRESEWQSVHDWLKWASATCGQFDFHFDKDQVDKYVCYLEEPQPGTGAIEPQRDTHPGTLLHPVTLRVVNGALVTTQLLA